jgi:hypothetical protein
MTPAHGYQADQALLRHNRSTGPDGYRFFRYASGLFHCAARVLALFIAAEGNIDHSLPLLITAEGNIDPPLPPQEGISRALSPQKKCIGHASSLQISRAHRILPKGSRTRHPPAARKTQPPVNPFGPN